MRAFYPSAHDARPLRGFGSTYTETCAFRPSPRTRSCAILFGIKEKFMQTRRLGRTDLSIAPLVLGGNVFGWTADKKISFEVLDRFAAAGLTAIDTADVYSAWAPGNSGGESETIIGEWMKARGNRSRVIVITKVGSPMGKGKEGLKASYVAEAVEASLRRLQTDAIDLYLSHWPDMATPVEETLGAYQRLIKEGKIRWCGASNLSAKLLDASLAAARAKGLPRYEVLQPEYSLADRHEFESGLADLCQREQIGVITYFSLAKGFLSGKYRSEADLSKSPRGDGVKAYLNPRGFRILDALEAVAASHKAKPAEVALAWAMTRPGVTAPIASATSIEQTESLVRATELALTAADMDALNTASAP
jgi:aryl-alcohol dehydrogenase-like predicted oxidoreductase